ncbi:hypothetical protein QLX41_gp061 [Listeria phage LMTA-94]|uniref:Uncharacterized protein n=2 Tax=Pecentumvirus TaxID=1857844 RepID=A0A068CB96_9CAUD|nr:hypothetical protein QLX41_gp061 [Listeria phage LMTA-94]AID17149.1 hypothetical protein [Listeria phage LMTA-94]AII27297.1 hypothetical protein [Listeria phage LMTA-34]
MYELEKLLGKDKHGNQIRIGDRLSLQLDDGEYRECVVAVRKVNTIVLNPVALTSKSETVSVTGVFFVVTDPHTGEELPLLPRVDSKGIVDTQKAEIIL